jgi:hypothetical protein
MPACLSTARGAWELYTTSNNLRILTRSPRLDVSELSSGIAAELHSAAENWRPGRESKSVGTDEISAATVALSELFSEDVAHQVAARRFGVEMRGITLFIFGGVAEMTDEQRWWGCGINASIVTASMFSRAHSSSRFPVDIPSIAASRWLDNGYAVDSLGTIILIDADLAALAMVISLHIRLLNNLCISGKYFPIPWNCRAKTPPGSLWPARRERHARPVDATPSPQWAVPADGTRCLRAGSPPDLVTPALPSCASHPHLPHAH